MSLIFQQQKDQIAQNRLLLEKIKKRPAADFNTFAKVLCDCGNGHLAELLVQGISAEQHAFKLAVAPMDEHRARPCESLSISVQTEESRMVDLTEYISAIGLRPDWAKYEDRFPAQSYHHIMTARRLSVSGEYHFKKVTDSA